MYLCTPKKTGKKTIKKNKIMDNKSNNKGMSFVPKNEVSAEAKSKLNKLAESKKEYLNKLVNDYNAGKLTHQKIN